MHSTLLCNDQHAEELGHQWQSQALSPRNCCWGSKFQQPGNTPKFRHSILDNHSFHGSVKFHSKLPWSTLHSVCEGDWFLTNSHDETSALNQIELNWSLRSWNHEVCKFSRFARDLTVHHQKQGSESSNSQGSKGSQLPKVPWDLLWERLHILWCHKEQVVFHLPSQGSHERDLGQTYSRIQWMCSQQELKGAWHRGTTVMHTKGSSQNLMETSGNSASLSAFLWAQSLNSTSIAPGVLAVAMQCNQKKGRKELCLLTTTGLVHIFALQTLLPSQIRKLSIAVNGKWKSHTDAQNHLPSLRTWEHLRLPPSSMILNGTSAHQN